MAEVGSLRLYTTSTFHLVNNPLRTRAAVHPLAVTVLHISRGLKKLRALHMSTDEDGESAGIESEVLRQLESNRRPHVSWN